MIQIKKVQSIEQLSELKQQYINQTTAPLDGMWLCGFVPMANHYGFYEKSELIGFCCINMDGYLLQFHLCPENRNQASILLGSILTHDHSDIEKINGAFASTAEPSFLSLCLDSFPTFKVNGLMYQLDEKSKKIQGQKPGLDMRFVKSDQLNEAINFAKNAIGASEEWLTGYFGNLINRQELYGYWQNGRLLATGESRGFDDYQTEYGDLGFIVGESQRGKGLGTKILKELIYITKAKGLKPICSTEESNIGAQKAISRVGFFAGNRIVQFDFHDDVSHAITNPKI